MPKLNEYRFAAQRATNIRMAYAPDRMSRDREIKEASDAFRDKVRNDLLMFDERRPKCLNNH